MPELKLPELGENITQGTVTKILVKAGDSIKKGQNILELETDKAILEVPSSVDGVIGEILVKNGAVVKVGQPVFKMTGAETASDIKSRTQPPPAKLSATESNPPPTPKAHTTAVAHGMQDMTLPVLGENIEKGTVTKILVKAGETLKKGQNILEVETDKAILEVPSAMEGIIKEILIKQGAVVKVGQPIFKISGGPGTDVKAGLPSGGHSAIPTGIEKPSPTRGHVPLPRDVSPSPLPNDAALNVKAPQSLKPSAAPSQSPLPVRRDVPAAPSVRLLARELGIDIGQVPGTGKGGRISTEDVKAYCKMLNTSRPALNQGGSGPAGGAGMTAALQPLPNFTKWGHVRREAMSNVRRKTAEHLSYAWQTIPHVTQFDKVDVTELEKLRKTMSGTGKKISVTPFIIKVVAAALKKFPQFNTSVDMASQEIIYKDYVNIGVAVDTDRGLLVPVLKNVDRMSILQISDELTALAERARLKKTTLEEMQGGCLTISNLGGIGGTCFTPIVNWPEVAILGVSRGAMEPVYMEGQFVPRLMLPLSLSYDHRIIDGADGARFIRWVCEAIQQPFLLDLNK